MNENIDISQDVAVLVDGNNIEKSIHDRYNTNKIMIDFKSLIPRLLKNRKLNRLIYFREGDNISEKFTNLLNREFYGTTVPCGKSADIPLTIKAIQLAGKVDTIIIMSGDSDYIELIKHLKISGVRVEIVSEKKTTSNKLIEKADTNYFLKRKDLYKL